MPFCTTLIAGNTLPVVVLVTVIVALLWLPGFCATLKAMEDAVPVEAGSVKKLVALLTALQGHPELSVTAPLVAAAPNVKLPDVMVIDEQAGVCCVIVNTAA